MILGQELLGKALRPGEEKWEAGMSSNNLFLIDHVGDPAIAGALCLHSQGGRGGTKAPEGKESRLPILPARPGCRSHVNQAAHSL